MSTCERRRGHPLGRSHLLSKLARRKIGTPQQLARALHRRPRQAARKLGIETGGAAGFRQTLGEQEHISRPAPRHGRDRIEHVLIVDPHDIADRLRAAWCIRAPGRASRRHWRKPRSCCARPRPPRWAWRARSPFRSGTARASVASVRPAAIDRTTLPSPIKGSSSGMSLSIEVGLHRDDDDGRRRRQIRGVACGNPVTRGERLRPRAAAPGPG